MATAGREKLAPGLALHNAFYSRKTVVDALCKMAAEAAAATTTTTLPRPYTRRTFKRRLKQFDQLINEITLKDVQASPAEKRELITENVRFEDFCESIKTLFGADIRNQDIKPIYQKITANPDVSIDWSELFGSVGSSEANQNDGHEDGRTLEAEINIGAAAAKGENIEIFSVPSRRRVGQACGNRFRRDVAVSIQYIAPMDFYLTVSQRGTLSVWSNRFRLLSCFDVGEKAWATGCVYLPETRKIAVCTERSISLLDVRSTGKNQPQSIQISPLENTPQCVAHVTCEGGNRDALLMGDDQGHVTLLTIDMIDLTGPKPTSISGLGSNQKRTTAIEPSKLLIPPKTRKLHQSWVFKVKFIPELNCFASCCASEETSFLLESLDVFNDNRPVRNIPINKGVNAFDYSPTANVIATGGVDKVIRTWHPGIFNAPSGRLYGHMFTVVDIVMNDVDQHIISLSTARVIRVWDIQSLTALQVFNDTSDVVGEKRIYVLYYDKFHEQLMTGSSVIDVWPLKRAVQDSIQLPQTHDRPITAILYNVQLHQLVTGCTETVLKVWDLDTGRQLYRIDAAHGQYGELSTMAVDESGYRLATGASDGSIKVWDFGSGQELKARNPPLVRVDDENSTIISLMFCQIQGDRCIVTVGWCNRISVLSDSTKSHNLPTLFEFNYCYGADVIRPVSENVGNLVTSLAYFGQQSSTSRDGSDVTNSNPVSLLDTYGITCVGFSVETSCKPIMATGCSNGDVIVWDISTTSVWKILHINSGDDEDASQDKSTTLRDVHTDSQSTGPVIAILFITQPNNDRLRDDDTRDVDEIKTVSEATIDEDVTDTRVTTDSDVLTENDVDRDDTTSQRDNRLVVTSHSDGYVRVWSLENGELLCEVHHRNFEQISALCTNISGHTLITGDQKGYLARWTINDNKDLEDRIVIVKETVFWRAHMMKVIQLIYVDKLNALFSASADASVRIWLPNGARYIGFLGQTRPLTFNAKQQQHTPLNGHILPYDITEGPMAPLRSDSAVRKQQQQRRNRLWCPLLFDNARWMRPTTSSRKSAGLRVRRQGILSSSTAGSRESSFAGMKPLPKKKFFDALYKPCPRNQLDSYTTAQMSEGAIYRALPVYQITTPDRPKTPQLSLPKLSGTSNDDDSASETTTNRPPTAVAAATTSKKSLMAPPVSVRLSIGGGGNRSMQRTKVMMTAKRTGRKTTFVPLLQMNREMTDEQSVT